MWWELMNNMRVPTTDHHHHHHTSPPHLFTSNSSSTTQYYYSSSSSSSTTLQAMIPWHDNQELPESWSQLLMGGLVEEEERCSYTPFQTKKMGSWEDQMLYLSQNSHLVDSKINDQLSDDHKGYHHGSYGQGINEEIQAASRSSWSQIVQNSSPTSCVTTTTSLNSSSSMLDFSDNKAQKNHHRQLDHSSMCNSTPTGSACKKPRVQVSTAQSTFKVRKEKLGDRITALHQLVSPFGKTDTASVLLEAIGYIRFLQSQIQALSTPYLGSSTGTGGGTIKQSAGQGERSCIFPEDPGQLLNDNCMMKRRGPPDQDGVDEPKDLRSRGLCLVPLSFTMHVGNDNAADYWAPAFGGGFQ